MTAVTRLAPHPASRTARPGAYPARLQSQTYRIDLADALNVMARQKMTEVHPPPSSLPHEVRKKLGTGARSAWKSARFSLVRTAGNRQSILSNVVGSWLTLNDHAATRRASLVSQLRYEADGDALDAALEEAGGELPGPLTQLFPDSAQSILAHNDSPDIGFDTSLNPYRGCEHGCIYCYARPTHEFLGYSAGQDFETKIMVKENAPELLRRELAHRRWQPRVVALSGVTDCYQPAERKLRLTRSCLEVFAEYRNPVMVITKNHLVTRDKDVLADLARHHAAAVCRAHATANHAVTTVALPCVFHRAPQFCLRRVFEAVRARLESRFWSSFGRAAESAQHRSAHRQPDQVFLGGGQELVVLGEPPVVAQPSEGAFHHPASFEHREGRHRRWFDALRIPGSTRASFHPEAWNHVRPRVAASAGIQPAHEIPNARK